MAHSVSLRQQRFYAKSRRSGVALVITLSLLTVLVLLLIAFVSMAQLDHTATASYSKSMGADEMAHAALNLVVAQLEMEMGKDAPADTTTGGNFANAPVYTNVMSANIEPQGIVTNATFPSLIKTSTNAPFFTPVAAAGSLGLIGQLEASTASTTTSSQNGRSISPKRWGQSYFGTGGAYFSDAQAPYWVIMTRSGPTNAASMAMASPPTSGSLNNSSSANTNYAIGRFAYAIYNEGGLLDVTAAGSPVALTPAQQDQVKGMLAGADLSQVSGVTPATLTTWRNTASGSGASASTYLNSLLVGTSTNAAYTATNAAGSVFPGDTTFVSRQDLINAALDGQAGLTTAALPNLTTFTRELNQPSWAPVTPAGSTINYANIENAAASANRFVPLVRVASVNPLYQSYHDILPPSTTTAAYNDPIAAGDPVVRRRFSLARLAWLTYNGPSADLPTTDPEYNAAGTDAAILACFGLKWATTGDSTNYGSAKVWQYVGSTISSGAPTEQSSIKTLYQVAQETTPREPNFFELLQAGILSGSLATDGGTSSIYGDSAQIHPEFQILRIGANIICQYNPDQYPRLIEYLNPADGESWVAAGVQNLPYVNLFKDVTGQSPDDPNINNYTGYTNGQNAYHYAALYWMIGLWNPHQQNSQTVYSRPPIRLCVETPSSEPGVGFSSGWASPAYSTLSLTGEPGYYFKIGHNTTYAQLSSGTLGKGVNGFLNPALLTSADVASAAPAFPASGKGQVMTGTLSGGWTTLQVPGSSSSSIFETYRMPDLQVDLAQKTPTVTKAFYLLPSDYVRQIVLEYQDKNNNWVPYDYWTGINDSGTWQYYGGYNWSSYYGGPTPAATTSGAPGPYAPLPALDSDFTHYLSGKSPVVFILNGDPRTFRFNPWYYTSDSTSGSANYLAIDSLWSGGSYPSSYAANAAGYGGGNELTGNAVPPYPSCLQQVPSKFAGGLWYFPAVLCRNNAPTSPSTAPNSSYLDPDGIQRIGDSGLFSNNPTAANSLKTGNPFYIGSSSAYTEALLSGQRVADRPIILNRAFNHVADLGYTFRDDPWRSLDFFSLFKGSSTSADSGLLDLFSVHEEPMVVAGRVDLNTQNPTVLKSLLSQTVIDAVGNITGSANTAVSSTAMTQMAGDLQNFTAATPLVNKDQLVTKLNPMLTAADFGASSNSDLQNVKACRESYIRTMADVGQTRTWNLMIDLVAQAGRYPPNATSLDQFVVEGEKRYWLHIALDRFTGKVIDEKMEPVSE